MNQNHEHESFSGSCEPFQRIVPPGGGPGDARHGGPSSPFQDMCSSCESRRRLGGIRGARDPRCPPRPHPEEERATCTLTGGCSELPLSTSSPSTPARDGRAELFLGGTFLAVKRWSVSRTNSWGDAMSPRQDQTCALCEGRFHAAACHREAVLTVLGRKSDGGLDLHSN